MSPKKLAATLKHYIDTGISSEKYYDFKDKTKPIYSSHCWFEDNKLFFKYKEETFCLTIEKISKENKYCI